MGGYMIQSANGALTMDTNNSIYPPGTPIVGNPPNPPGGSGTIQPSQGWLAMLDPLGSNHYLIASGAPGASNLCVGIGAISPPGADVTVDATDRGAVLILQEQETVNNNYQLWDFLPVTGGAANAVFIQNPQTGYVIELQAHSTESSPLVVNPRRISNESYQLWTAVEQNGSNPIAPFVMPMAPYIGNLHGFDNYIFAPPNQGDHLIGLTFTIDIIEDVVVAGNAFSLQINCNAPYQGSADAEDYDWDAQWMQFGLFMMNNQIMLFNQVWGRGGNPASEFPSETAWSPPLLQLVANTIPAGTRIILNLCTDQNDFAIGMTGLALDSTGLPIGNPIYWPALGLASWHAAIDGGHVHQKAMAPVGSFQVLFCDNPQVQSVGAQFTSGMGTITITASSGISGLNSAPNPSAPGTAENSNMPYDLVPNPDPPARLVAHPFGISSPPHIRIPPPHVPSGLQKEVIILDPGGVLEIIPGDAPGAPNVIVEEPDPNNSEDKD